MITIIPAIDIIDGRCVRLSKGDYSQKKVYDSSPVEMAGLYAGCGVKRIHVVDLDGAKASSPVNLRVLEKVASRVDCEVEWGGGIADSSALRSVFDAGASQAIVGSVAALKPELFMGWLTQYGASRMALGADVRQGLVAVKGWFETSEITVDELIGRFPGLSQVICTDISRDGMLQGPSDELYLRLQRDYPGLIFTVSGGIASMDDVRRLDSLGLKRVIIGKAVYEGRISLNDIKLWCANA